MDRTLRLPVRNNRELGNTGSMPVTVTGKTNVVFLAAPILIRPISINEFSKIYYAAGWVFRGN